jgi:hypothetical protein
MLRIPHYLDNPLTVNCEILRERERERERKREGGGGSETHYVGGGVETLFSLSRFPGTAR